MMRSSRKQESFSRSNIKLRSREILGRSFFDENMRNHMTVQDVIIILYGFATAFIFHEKTRIWKAMIAGLVVVIIAQIISFHG